MKTKKTAKRKTNRKRHNEALERQALSFSGLYAPGAIRRKGLPGCIKRRHVPTVTAPWAKKAASSAARAEAEILQQTPLFPLQSRSTHRSKVSLPNARSINISPIFRHIQTHMLLWNTCVRSSQKPSPIRISWHCPLVPDRTVWEMMYWSFFIP